MLQIKGKKSKKSTKLLINSIELNLNQQCKFFAKRLQLVRTKKNIQVFTPYIQHYPNIKQDSIRRLKSQQKHYNPHTLDYHQSYFSQLAHQQLHENMNKINKKVSVQLCKSLSIDRIGNNSGLKQQKNQNNQQSIQMQQKQILQKQQLPTVFIKNMMVDSDLYQIKKHKFKNQLFQIVMKKQEIQRKRKVQRQRQKIISHLNNSKESQSFKRRVNMYGPVSISIHLPSVTKSMKMNQSFYKKAALQKQLQKKLILRSRQVQRAKQDRYIFSNKKRNRTKTQELTPWKVDQPTTQYFY